MKKLRLILPVLAIVFAVAGALATDVTPKMAGSIEVSEENDPCEPLGFCTPDENEEFCSVQANVKALYSVQEIKPCPSFDAKGIWE